MKKYLIYAALSLGVPLWLPVPTLAQLDQAPLQASTKGSLGKSNLGKSKGNEKMASEKTNNEKPTALKTAKSPYVLPISEKAVRAAYPLEACYDKTTHIIFPSKILYLDIGSSSVVADKAEPAENVLRVKANSKGFEQTTLVVITEEGKYYPFLVDYNSSPQLLNINIAGNAEQDAEYAQQTGIIRSIMPEGIALTGNTLSADETKDLSGKVIDKKRFIHNVGVMKMRMSFLLTGVYVYQKTLFIQVFFENRSDIDYQVDFFKFFVKDRDVTKRMAYQEFEVPTFSQYPSVSTTIPQQGKRSMVFALPLVTYGEDKIMEIQMYENKGGRHLRFEVDSDVILRAKGL